MILNPEVSDSLFLTKVGIYPQGNTTLPPGRPSKGAVLVSSIVYEYSINLLKAEFILG
jgi:hypothetical protein